MFATLLSDVSEFVDTVSKDVKKTVVKVVNNSNQNNNNTNEVNKENNVDQADVEVVHRRLNSHNSSISKNSPIGTGIGARLNAAATGIGMGIGGDENHLLLSSKSNTVTEEMILNCDMEEDPQKVEFLQKFDMNAHNDEIAKILSDPFNHMTKKSYQNLVPSKMTHRMFFERYLYLKNKLKLDHQRLREVELAMTEEESVKWEDDEIPQQQEQQQQQQQQELENKNLSIQVKELKEKNEILEKRIKELELEIISLKGTITTASSPSVKNTTNAVDNSSSIAVATTTTTTTTSSSSAAGDEEESSWETWE